MYACMHNSKRSVEAMQIPRRLFEKQNDCVNQTNTTMFAEGLLYDKLETVSLAFFLKNFNTVHGPRRAQAWPT